MEAMQPKQISSVLRPLSVGELLDRAFGLYRDHFFLFFGIGVLPQAVASAIAIWTDMTRSLRRADPSGSTELMLLALLLISLPVRMVALAISHAMTMPAVSSAYLERPITLRETYALAKPYLGTLFWLAVQTTIRVGAGLILFVIPGVFLALNYSVSVPAAVFENLKAREALKRSTELTQGYRGRILGLYSFYGLFSYIIGTSASYIVQHHHPAFLIALLIELVRFLSFAVASPLRLIIFAILYYDLRVRKEAFDLEFMIKSVAQANETAEAAKA